MDIKELILMGIILILCLFIFLISTENARAVGTANYVIAQWNSNQEYLIGICKIDYNKYLHDETLKKINDLNKLVNPVKLPFSESNSLVS